MAIIVGVITKIHAGPYSSGWCVATLRTHNGQSGKVSGVIPGAAAGLHVRLDGAPGLTQYGMQFIVTAAHALPSIMLPAKPAATEKPMDEITGTVTHIRNSKEEENWYAFDVRTATGSIRCSGVIPGLVEGTKLEATGKWWQSEYGLQFRVINANVSVPKSPKDVLSFLGEKVDGLGKKKMDWIRGAIGDRLPDVLNGDRLAAIAEIGSVKGIGLSLGKLIVDRWILNRDCWPVVSVLQEAGVPLSIADRAFQEFRGRNLNILETLKTDPYLLCKYVRGITFDRSEQIWIANGRPDTAHATRTEQGLLHTLVQSEEDGNTCLPQSEAVTKTAGFLGIKPDQVSAAIPRLSIGRELLIETNNGVRMAYRGKTHECERRTAELLAKLAKTEPGIAIHPDAYGTCVSNGLGYINLDLSGQQRIAVETAVRAKLLLLTGQAGSGKTTITKAIVWALASIPDLRVTCAAPTGLASQRLAALTDFEATTIHRLLGYNPGTESYEHTASNPIPTDVLIIDEMSLVDLSLFRDLLDAVAPSTRVILVGDPNQLESVGHGAVLRDLIQSRCLPHIHLDQIFRQGSGSGIIESADDVLHHRAPSQSSEVMICSSPTNKIPADVVSRVDVLLQSGADAGDIQVLAPIYAGPGGVIALNNALQQKINRTPGDPIWTQNRKRDQQAYEEKFYLDDRVMQTKNNRELGIYNGDFGMIVDQTPDALLIKFGSGDKITEYPTKLISEELTLAYAMTVHKSQGSEFKHVILSVPRAKMWSRNLLYTAITRSRESLYIVEEPATISNALAAQITPRTTTLKHRIVERLATRMSAVI